MEFDNLDGVILYGIDAKTITDGIMPDFMYVTSLDLTDTSEENVKAIKDEAYKLHDIMMEFFPGIDKDFNAFLYGATSEIPDNSSVQIQRYGTVIHIE